MHIRLVKSDKKRFLDLLLLADEQESMIDRYIERGDLFVMEEKGEAKAVAVVTREGQGVYELKNLAVAPAYQRKGYGRMMVEPIEGFCNEDEYGRSASQIRGFEKMISELGGIIIKFWMEISPEEQLARFEARRANPVKSWKITDEDWRNREKWPLYETAVEEMLQKTSTAYAPWHIIESVDKKYARIRVLQIVTDALEQAVNEHITRGVKKECAKPKKDRS